MAEYTRELLIELCEKAFVKQEDWKDRDSADAQAGIAMSLMLLKAGCKFEASGSEIFTHTIDITFWVKDFTWWDVLDADEVEYPDGVNNGKYTYYIPTQYKLDQVAGKDWYNY